MNFELTTDFRQLQTLNSMRVMVAAPLLYTFTIHFLFLGISSLFPTDIKIERLYDHGRRLVLYGIAAIISINFLQYGIYHAIVAWVTLVWVIIMHSMTFARQMPQQFQNIAVLVYYILIAIWFVGIVVFYMYNALAP